MAAIHGLENMCENFVSLEQCDRTVAESGIYG